jgi:ribosomal protein S18 acetylase RimI-like enzyme
VSSLTPVSLDEVSLDQFAPLIDEETASYLDAYRWDFHATAHLASQLVAARSLTGLALLDGSRLAAYSYFVVEGSKAVIGDAYVRDAWACPQSERLLMDSSLDALRAFPHLRRLESQPMMLRHPYSHPHASRFERLFLELDLTRFSPPNLPPHPLSLQILPWNWRREEDSAQLLFLAYRNHVDASINDQYRTLAGARTYVSNVLRYPSCGFFHPASSFLLADRTGTRLLGLVFSNIAQLPSGPVGHISQITIDSSIRHRGAGRMLILTALARFAALGCSHATLSVTSANASALQLYRSLGFAERSRLWAYVWANWPS